MEINQLKFTDEDFEIFKAQCRYWVETLGLHDWEILYVFESDDDGSIASTLGNMESMKAVISFAKALKKCNDIKAMTKAQIIAKAGQHEVLEVLLFKLQALGQSRDYNHQIFNSEIHAVLHRLARILDEYRTLKENNL